MSTLVTQYIDSDSSAQQYAQQCRGSTIIAVDTEFERSRTFYAIPGLIQLAVEGQIGLIDPLSVSVESYKSALLDPASLKLMHACGEDLELLYRLCGAVPEPLFDTQLAATYAGFRPQMGCQGLVKEMLGIDIPKHQTRSDWLQRPLSDDQIEYAALDVLYLEEIYQGLMARLQKLDRLDWVKEDCHLLVVKGRREILAGDYYRHVGNAWQLLPRQLAILKVLSEWREEEIRRIDIPRSFLISDALLLDIVRQKPNSKSKLSNISGFKPGILRRYGDLLLAKMEEAEIAGDDHLPIPVLEPLLKAVPSVAKKLKVVIRANAEKFDLPPEVLCRKKLLEALMTCYVKSAASGDDIQLPEEFKGWRSDVVLEPLIELLDAHQGELKRFVVGDAR